MFKIIILNLLVTVFALELTTLPKEFKSPNTLEYDFYPAPLSQSFSFKVKAAHDVFILLTSETKEEHPMLEFNIGCCWQSRILMRKNSSIKRDETVTPAILDENEFHEFWVKWQDNTYQIGRNNDEIPLMSWKDYFPFPIKYVGIRTAHGANGTWILNGLSKDLNQFEISPKMDVSEENSDSNSDEDKEDVKNFAFLYKVLKETNYKRNDDEMKLAELRGNILRLNDLRKELYENYNIFTSHIGKAILSANIYEIYRNNVNDIFKEARDLHRAIIMCPLKDNKDRDDYLKNSLYRDIKKMYFDFNIKLQSMDSMAQQKAVSENDVLKQEITTSNLDEVEATFKENVFRQFKATLYNQYGKNLEIKLLTNDANKDKKVEEATGLDLDEEFANDEITDEEDYNGYEYGFGN